MPDISGLSWRLVIVPIFLFVLCVGVVKCQQKADDIPNGAASLAFVFDITGSMYDDLVQVIEGAAKILATTLSRREKPLYNYVLVPFHDPGTCMYIIFKSKASSYLSIY